MVCLSQQFNPKSFQAEHEHFRPKSCLTLNLFGSQNLITFSRVTLALDITQAQKFQSWEGVEK